MSYQVELDGPTEVVRLVLEKHPPHFIVHGQDVYSLKVVKDVWQYRLIGASVLVLGDEGTIKVPVIATDEMVEAGYDATRMQNGVPKFADAGFCLGHANDIWNAMIAAAQPNEKTLDKSTGAGSSGVVSEGETSTNSTSSAS